MRDRIGSGIGRLTAACIGGIGMGLPVRVLAAGDPQEEFREGDPLVVVLALAVSCCLVAALALCRKKHGSGEKPRKPS